MEVSRRSFLKRGLLLGGGAASGLAGAAAHAAGGSKKPYKLTSVNETTNICCYCSGGCGTICSTRNGELINLEGDPDHPVNLGGLCPKGAAMWGLRNIVTKERQSQNHPARVLHPMVLRPGSKEWTQLTWEQAALEIARHVKKTRDATFVEKEGDVTVNRCDGIASLGAAQLNNEEGWLVQKFARSLGVLAIDNQTRVCHSSTVSGLAPSFGRGSMTSHWCDFANSDVIMSIGSNNVENHPLSSRWVERAQDKGATWIVVDPRYSRSAARADIYARIRPGSDLAFYGGLSRRNTSCTTRTPPACCVPTSSSTSITASFPAGIRKRSATTMKPGATTSITRPSGTLPKAPPSPGSTVRARRSSRRLTSRSSSAI